MIGYFYMNRWRKRHKWKPVSIVRKWFTPTLYCLIQKKEDWREGRNRVKYEIWDVDGMMMLFLEIKGKQRRRRRDLSMIQFVAISTSDLWMKYSDDLCIMFLFVMINWMDYRGIGDSFRWFWGWLNNCSLTSLISYSWKYYQS